MDAARQRVPGGCQGSPQATALARLVLYSRSARITLDEAL